MFSIAALMIAGLSLLSISSCGNKSELVSIQILPGVETFGAPNIPVSDNAGSSVQLRALGSYIHPPVTHDITNQVTWASNTPDIATVDSTGLLTATGVACGNALISATVATNNSSGGISSNGAIVTSNMTANVVCFTGTSGGGASLLTAQIVSNPGTGSVTFSPSGINCVATCSESFATGTAVNVTATPNVGSTFGGWSGCDSVSGQTCIINSLNADTTVAVTFN
jgi:hypothetical protein